MAKYINPYDYQPYLTGGGDPGMFYASGSDDYYDAIDEARERYREESDRDYELRAQTIKQQAARIAIEKGQAEANAWYQRQMVGLAKDRLKEEQRQFDLRFGEDKRQFNVTTGGYMDDGKPTLRREEFQTNATGYFNGAPTLEREQFGDQSLFNWTQLASELGQRPEDYWRLRQMQNGIAANVQNIPGLNWQALGQRGNQTFVGQPQSASLASVMGPMGLNTFSAEAQKPGGGMPSPGLPPGEQVFYASGAGAPAASGNWAAQASAQLGQNIASGAGAGMGLNPEEQQFFNTARAFAMDPHQAAPGWWESQDPLTQKLIQGAAESSGLDWASVMSKYNRSRWAGGAGAAAA